MKKILLCASRISHILNFHLPYIQAFQENGYQVDIAAEGTAQHPLLTQCYDLRFVKNPLSRTNLTTIRQLQKLLQDNHYTMVCSNATLAGAALRLAVRRLKKNDRPRCVHISHGYMFDTGRSLRSLLYRTVEKRLSDVTDTLIVMNEEDLFLAQHYRLSKHIVFTNGMGLCGDRFPAITAEERTALRQKLGADDTTKILLCVGEFSARKNQPLLIEALNRLPYPQRRQYLLVFAGEGATQEECQRLTERYELHPFVRFLGQVREPNRLYRSADILLSASVMEGLPFNVMEALYCGLPVIASPIKGHYDLITDGENGLLFSPDAPNAAASLAHLLQNLLTDTALYRRLKDHAFLPDDYQIEQVRPYLFNILVGGHPAVEIPTPEVTYP